MQELILIANPYHDIKFGSSYTYHQFNPGETNLNILIDYPSLDTSNSDFRLDTVLNFSPKKCVKFIFM